MVKVKPLEEIKRNYVGSAGTAAARYAAAIPRITWQSEALAGQALYVTQMSNPSVLARRADGISDVSDSEFKAALSSKGAPRISAGISGAGDKMSSGYAPIRSAIEGVSLPARTADPDTNIENRVKPIVHAMRRAAGKE